MKRIKLIGNGKAPMALTHLKDLIPDLEDAKAVFKNGFTPEKSAAFQRQLSTKDISTQEILRHVFIKENGNNDYSLGLYREAIENYRKAVTMLIGFRNVAELPISEDSSEMYSVLYTGEYMVGVMSVVLLASCFNNIAQCKIKLNMPLEAIDWVQEVVKLYTLQEEISRVESYPWLIVYPTVLDYPTIYVKSQLRLAEIFLWLGNTAASAYCSFACEEFGRNIYAENEELEKLRDKNKLKDLMLQRHPDFRSANENVPVVVNPQLQMRGSWTKMYSLQGARPRKRSGFSSWIWRSTLYVYGGMDYCSKTEDLLDIWCIDLRTMNSWRRLPGFPPHFYLYLYCMPETKMRVWNDAAWLFFGRVEYVIKFDLVSEKWHLVPTKWESAEPWPYSATVPDGTAVEYCMEFFEGKLHIFGGAVSYKCTGVNLHMCLDLSTLVWTKLGGTTDHTKLLKGMPMFRKSAASWVIPDEKRMYILYGHASRPKAKEFENQDGDLPDHQYEDMWSYSFVQKRWRHERFRGNFPAPRTKMACVYHPALHKVLVFGGVNVRLPTFDERHTKTYYHSTHFGDTFVLDMKTRIWKQVLTRTFPHHRAHCQMNVDESTGSVYLYGGLCSSNFITSQNADPHMGMVSLGDLWHLDLDLDLPGQNFNEIEYSQDVRRKFWALETLFWL